jgi:hypothetical protein
MKPNMAALMQLGVNGYPFIVDPSTGRRLLACSGCDCLLWYDAGEGVVVSAICPDCEQASVQCDFSEKTYPH